MGDIRFKRVCICAPGVDHALLHSAARLTALLPSADLHVVAGTDRPVLESLPAAVAEAFGRNAGRVRLQLVPEPSWQAFCRLARAEGADLLVVAADLTGQHAPGAPCSVVRLPGSGFSEEGHGVLTLLADDLDASPLAAAIELARRLPQPRVVACHVYFNETAIVCDAWEEREAERRRRALDLLVARASSGDVAIDARVVQCPSLSRALLRPECPRAPSLIVSTRALQANVPVLHLRLAPEPDAAKARRVWSWLGSGTESEPA